MISYHPHQNGGSGAYGQGFLRADTLDLARISRGICEFAWSPVIWTGGRRRQDHFEFADLCVLDFDSPEMTLAQALNIFSDMAHIIGTTKSHRKPKGGVTCDRFRVVLRFASRISALKTYRYSLKQVVQRYPADPAATDGARFFFPCTEIVSVLDDGFVEEVRDPPAVNTEQAETRKRYLAEAYRSRGAMPPWLKRFLDTGDVVDTGRNHTVYRAAAKLTELGEPADAVRAMVMASPFSRDGLEHGEVERALENGIKGGCVGRK